MQIKYNRKKKQIHNDLTPMIDIIFQLILFFMAASTLAKTQSIKVKLPETTTSISTSTENKMIHITIDEDGSIYLDEELISIIQLKEGNAFDNYVPDSNGEMMAVNLEAHQNVDYGTVISVMDALRKNGYTNINLRTELNTAK